MGWEHIIKKEKTEAYYMKEFFRMIKEMPNRRAYLVLNDYYQDAKKFAKVMMAIDKKEKQKAILANRKRKREEDKKRYGKQSGTGIGPSVSPYDAVENYQKYPETSLMEVIDAILEEKGGKADFDTLMRGVEDKHSRIISERELEAYLKNIPSYKKLNDGKYTKA